MYSVKSTMYIHVTPAVIMVSCGDEILVLSLCMYIYLECSPLYSNLQCITFLLLTQLHLYTFSYMYLGMTHCPNLRFAKIGRYVVV